MTQASNPVQWCSRRGALRALVLVLTFFVVCFPHASHAGLSLDEWRSQVSATRVLVENDAHLAHVEAQRLLLNSPPDVSSADRVRALNLLARTEMYLAQTDQAAEHVRQAVDMAQRSDDRVGQAEAELVTALNAIYQARVDESMAATTRALALLDGVDQPDLLGEAMLRTAMMYRRKGQIEDAVTVSIQQMEVARRVNTPWVLTYAHQGLAISYEQSGRPAEAREHYDLMLAHARNIPSKWLESEALLGLSKLNDKTVDLQTREEQIRLALSLCRSIGGPVFIGRALFSLGEFMRFQHQPDEALKMFNESADVWSRHGIKIGLWWTLKARSDLHRTQGHLDAAQVDAKHSHVLAEEIGLPLYLGESAKSLAAVAAARGDHALAYRYSVEATELAQRAERERVSSRMLELVDRYKTESQRREINELTHRSELQAAALMQNELQQRWLWTALAGGFIVFAGTAYFLFHLRRSHRSLDAAHKQLQHTQQKLQATLNALPDMLYVLGLDGRCHEFHSSGAYYLQTADTLSIVGQVVYDLLSPDSASVCKAALLEAHERGSSDGKQFAVQLPPCLAWFELSVARQPSEPGQEPLFVVLARDISERKRMDELLRAREQEFRATVEHSPDYMARYDSQCRRVYVNPACQSLFNLPIERILGSSPQEFSVLQDVSAFQQRIRGVLETGHPDRMEFSFTDCHGKEHRADMRLVPEFGPDGAVVSVLAVARDITEQHKLMHEVEVSTQQLRQLATRTEVAREDERRYLKRELHDELGQRLLALRWNISFLDIQLGEVHPLVRERAQQLLGAVDATIGVIRNVVTSLRPSALDMGLVAALEWLVSEYAKQSDTQFELNISDDTFEMDDARATAVFRIVQESLTNGVKHARADKVEVALQSDGTHLLLEVTDDGQGFDPAQVKEKSFGLLGIRERVLMLGGELDLSSAPGGTAIRVRFPIDKLQSHIQVET